LLCSTHHASSKRELLRNLQELFMGPGISSSAFWVSKGLRILKICSAISALYNQKYYYATSGIYHNVISPPSYAGFLFRGRWAEGCHNVWYTLQNHQSSRREGKKTHLHLLICAGGGHLCHNLISGNTKEKLPF